MHAGSCQWFTLCKFLESRQGIYPEKLTTPDTGNFKIKKYQKYN